MGWTFEEYQNTPAHILAEVSMFINTENKINADNMERAHGR